MSDLTAWVPLWKKCPELVPGGWVRLDEHGQPNWCRWDRSGFRVQATPTELADGDIDAQIGRAVAWLVEPVTEDRHGCVVMLKTDAKDQHPGMYLVCADHGRHSHTVLDALRIACEIRLGVSHD